jgi:hypothetical protein
MPSEVVVSTDNDAVQRYLWLYHLRGVLAHGGEIALAMTVDLRLADIRGSLTASQRHQADTIIEKGTD